jgi:uncharacterized protein (TIGR02594 family)
MSGLEIAKQKLGLDENCNRKELRLFFLKYGIICDPYITPWCAAFVNACERAADLPGTGLLNARSFLNYGELIKIERAKIGDIVIFSRSNSLYLGHVAYLIDILDDDIKTLGGNQNNSVCYSYYPRNRLLGIRRYIHGAN